MRTYSNYSVPKSILVFIMVALTSSAKAQKENVITFNVGSMAITVLSEGQQQGNKGVLIGATEEMLKESMPGGTYPSSVNAFLVEADGKTVLYDAALGIKLFDNLKAYGKKTEDVDAIVITHMHGDHIGGLLRNGEKAFANAELYIAKPEHDYWMSSEDGAQARSVINAYKDKLHLFVPGEIGGTEQLLPGVCSVAAYGHTPGHTGYMLESDGEKIFIWGDLTHAMAIQMPYPEVAVRYDVDPKQAVESRLKLLSYLSEHKIRIAGMHNAFPAIGDISKGKLHGYSFTPVCECEGR